MKKMLTCLGFGLLLLEAQGVAGEQAQAVAMDQPRALADLSPASLDRAARAWAGAAASGDLIPAVTVEAPVVEVPSSYLVDVPIILDISRRCRWRPEQGRRALLLCVDDFGFFPRNDLPRAQLLVPRISTPGRANRPPRGAIDIVVR